jgi:hypothetical protein
LKLLKVRSFVSSNRMTTIRASRFRMPTTRFGHTTRFEIPQKDNIDFPIAQNTRMATYVLVDGDGYRRVYSTNNVGEDQLMALYTGTIVSTSDPDFQERSTRWMVSVPGLRYETYLDSQILGDWTWERYVKAGEVGGFVDSSRSDPSTHNYPGANCKISWYLAEYTLQTLTPRTAKAALISKREIKADEELLWDYSWV